MTQIYKLPSLTEYFAALTGTDPIERLETIIKSPDILYLGTYRLSTTVRTIDELMMTRCCKFPLYPMKIYDYTAIEGVVKLNIKDPDQNSSIPIIKDNVALGLLFNATGMLYIYGAQITPTRPEYEKATPSLNWGNETTRILVTTELDKADQYFESLNKTKNSEDNALTDAEGMKDI